MGNDVVPDIHLCCVLFFGRWLTAKSFILHAD